ncbi:hypothetical protein BGZ81_002869, partial [Podila clonocystis]
SAQPMCRLAGDHPVPMARVKERTLDHTCRILYPSKNKDKDNHLPINNKNYRKVCLIRMLLTTPILYFLHIHNLTRICQQHLLLSLRTWVLISTRKRLRRPKSINTIISIFLTTRCGDGHWGRPCHRRDVDHNGPHSPGTTTSTTLDWA